MAATIRQATLGDERTLSDLNRNVQEIHVANRGQYFKPHVARDVADWFGLCLQNPAVQIWIAEESGRAVGYVCVRHCERKEDVYHFAHRWHEIDEIGVHPAFQRTGIGRALVQRVFEEARSKGISEVELCSWSFNESAQRAFQRLGFDPKLVRFGIQIRSGIG